MKSYRFLVKISLYLGAPPFTGIRDSLAIVPQLFNIKLKLREMLSTTTYHLELIQPRDDFVMYFSKALFISFLVLLILIQPLLLIKPILFQKILGSPSPSSSPVFGRQTIIDDSADWLDVWRGRHTENGSDFTDIEAANYFSDGRVLNATLWLPSFSETPALDKRVNYGMYIDADLNNRTGIAGMTLLSISYY